LIDSSQSGGVAIVGSQPVVVIGAGITGLATAFQLQERGHRVVLLERAGRAGGRVYTLREGLPSGLYAELGAERFPDTHDLVFSYIDRFGLSVREFKRNEARVLYSIRRHVFESTPQKLLDQILLRTAGGKHVQGIQQVMDHCLRPLLAAVARVPVSKWAHAGELRAYDALSVTEYLLSTGLSSENVEFLTVGVGEVEKGSIIDFLRHHLRSASAKRWYNIDGGAGRLVDAFQNRLRDAIRFDAEVVRVKQLDRGVEVYWREGSREVSESGMCAVFAVPYTALRRISITPALSEAKTNAVNELYYAPAVKIVVQLRSGFWTQHGERPRDICTDHPLEARLTPPTGTSPVGILSIYAKGKLARQLDGAGLGKRNLIATVMSEIFPAFDSYVERIHFHHWSHVPGIWGAYSFYLPCQFFALDPYISENQGLLYFAGDHTSELPGWVQGALQSSHRVVSEVCG